MANEVPGTGLPALPLLQTGRTASILSSDLVGEAIPLNHLLVDKVVVITTPELTGSGAKALEGITDAR